MTPVQSVSSPILSVNLGTSEYESIRAILVCWTAEVKSHIAQTSALNGTVVLNQREAVRLAHFTNPEKLTSVAYFNVVAMETPSMLMGYPLS